MPGPVCVLICGLLAGQTFDAELTGDASLCSRPMGRVIDPLTMMGASHSVRRGRQTPAGNSRRAKAAQYSLRTAHG